MCARYAFFTVENLMREFMLLEAPELAALYNIAPTDVVPAVVQGEKGREVQMFQWGLVPSWAKDPSIGSRMINARAETLSEKPSFRAAFKKRRCLIPADGFYEWKGEKGHKQPYFIRMKSAKPFAFAGLWEHWEGVEGELVSCTIITTEPNELVSEVHNRMPVILPYEAEEMWLDSRVQNTETLMSLLRPFPANSMEAYEVSTLVNSVKNQGSEIVKRMV